MGMFLDFSTQIVFFIRVYFTLGFLDKEWFDVKHDLEHIETNVPIIVKFLLYFLCVGGWNSK